MYWSVAFFCVRVLSLLVVACGDKREREATSEAKKNKRIKKVGGKTLTYTDLFVSRKVWLLWRRDVNSEVIQDSALQRTIHLSRG